MKLGVKLVVPMACPTCQGEDFYIELSHPFGAESKCMRVRCEGCKNSFYTDKGVVPNRLKKKKLSEVMQCDLLS